MELLRAQIILYSRLQSGVSFDATHINVYTDIFNSVYVNDSTTVQLYIQCKLQSIFICGDSNRECAQNMLSELINEMTQ